MDDEKNDLNTTSIGREVAVFRALLNMTQQQFADVISSSRVTINKLEKIEDPSRISPDIAFRLYYITQKTINNYYFPNFTREKAKELQVRVENELLSHK